MAAGRASVAPRSRSPSSWGAPRRATAGSDDKAALAKELGADEVIDYRDPGFFAEFKRLTGKRGVDSVIEHVGGNAFDSSLRSLARGGRVVTCGATTGHEVTINLRLVFFKLLSILGSTMGSLGELHEILHHVEAGRVRPVVERRFSPLHKSPKATASSKPARHSGKWC